MSGDLFLSYYSQCIFTEPAADFCVMQILMYNPRVHFFNYKLF